MRRAIYSVAVVAFASFCLWAEETEPAIWKVHQVPGPDGVYYAGPEVTAPQLIRTVTALYPDDVRAKELQGMTVMALVIGANGVPSNIQMLHKHGPSFDEAALAAVMHSVFVPGKLAGKAVPVWIDVRVVFHADRSQAVPQVVIAERDLPPPSEAQFEDKHHSPLSYTPPIPIHTVDADFTDPFLRHPLVQVAVVSVLVGEDGVPKEARIRRGLGFGLDEKATAAVMHYRFVPATQKGKRVEASREIMVSFAKF